jgi:hypothetical protein
MNKSKWNSFSIIFTLSSLHPFLLFIPHPLSLKRDYTEDTAQLPTRSRLHAVVSRKLRLGSLLFFGNIRRLSFYIIEIPVALGLIRVLQCSHPSLTGDQNGNDGQFPPNCF